MPQCEAPPRVKKLPRSAQGKVLWANIPGFEEWFRQNATQMTNHELSDALDKAYKSDTTRGQIDRMRQMRGLSQSPDTAQRAYDNRSNVSPMPNFVREFGERDGGFFVAVEGDCFITSDWHIPHQKDDLFHRLLEMAEAWNVRTLIINGDFLNQDAFSHHRAHRFQVGWPEEKLAARAILERLSDVFKEIVYIMDNHDRRLLAAMEEKFRGKFDESDILDILTKGIRVRKFRPSVDYHYVTVNGRALPPLVPWRVTSPKEYRRVKLSLPHRLAQVYHQNIVVGGDHLFGMGLDDSSRFAIANSMCMIDPARTPYINVQDTTFPHWNPGFYLIRGNRLLAFPDHPAFTDWDEAVLIGKLLRKAGK